MALRRALIDPRTNRVCQLEETDGNGNPNFPVASPLFWVNCTDDNVTTDYTYDNSVFISPIINNP